ncbi:DUF3987 domain-containing protein [Thermoactinomyces sp. DSM 45892]|uniref:DUF3987 domain-containing protein n=1 Tax=Thermoactinomyces sp. DSM 45892 TaxID=1882753 RepID=UPI00089D3989|nr:DUF3987 domain-containing protein [Thermoactinomyces sp. DSM 45892]SDY22504.1 Bifunctional DNA primase/polymerase, N-terminal [Thermoactinomyces sp. DSM 45892]
MIDKSEEYTLSPLEEAFRLASFGLKVIPLHAPVNGECTCGRKPCKSAGKHPLWNDWASLATDDIIEIRNIWKKHPHANVGVPMGKVNEIFALDIDGPEGMNTLQEWIASYGEMPATWQIATGGGGMQLWYKMPADMDIPNSVKKMGVNIDVRGTGGQSVGPGSLHASGKRYQWVPGRRSDEMELAEAPDWLLQKIQMVMKDQRKVDQHMLNATDISFQLKSDTSSIMEKATGLMEKSSAFREVIMGQKPFPSASERDLSMANITAIRGWSDQEIVDLLLQYRQFHGEDLKHPTYYQITLTKAREWANENGWKEPDSIETEVDPIPLPQSPVVEPFPEGLFPEPMANFLRAASTSLGLPTDYVGAHALTFLGTAIGSSRMIELKPGYQQQPNLYTCIIADTGTGKSPAQEQAFSPILSFQNRYHDIHQQKMQEYEEAHRQYQAQLAVWKKKSKDEEIPEEPEKPQMKELYIVQATIEALIRALKENNRGLVLKADELSGWIRGMNQYKGGKGDDREQYLSLWSGTDIKVNRVRDNGEPIFIPKPFFAVTGNIPPDIVPTLEDEQGSEDGFIHRILFSYPDAQDPAEWTWTGVSPEAVQGYTSILERLYKLNHIEVGTKQKAKILPLSREAKKWWEEWYSIHITEMKDEDFPHKLRGPWAKMPNQMARIALIIHMARVVCDEAEDEEVDEISITRAAQMVKYFKSHARKVYLHLKKTQVDKRIEEAVEWIKKRGGTVKRREIQKNNVAGCKKATEVDQLFQELSDYGYGHIEEIKGKGRSTYQFSLHETC